MDLFLYSEPRQLASSAGRVLLGCLLAFLMDAAEFLALRVTSSVTLCVAGVFKVSAVGRQPRHIFCHKFRFCSKKRIGKIFRHALLSVYLKVFIFMLTYKSTILFYDQIA